MKEGKGGVVDKGEDMMDDDMMTGGEEKTDDKSGY